MMLLLRKSVLSYEAPKEINEIEVIRECGNYKRNNEVRIQKNDEKKYLKCDF